jgi:predicted transcriptional regulator of viral defense system
MKFIDLKNHFRDSAILSVSDIRKMEPGFDVRRLVEWQKKGYIKKIIRNFYVFSDQNIAEPALFVIANSIYSPSYISFEMALAHYQLIPESVYGITSAATKKTTVFGTPLGDFIYRSLKPELFFGYTLVPFQNQRYLIAEPEKALLDFFYLNPKLLNDNDFASLRINPDEFTSKISQEKLNKYLAIFDSPTLKKRISGFIKFINHADI